MKRPALYWTVLISLALGCSKDAVQHGGEPGLPIDLNTIFYADSISVISPMNGDTIPDIYPMFAWEATGSKMVFLGIFVNNINITAGQIANIDDNIWAWHSGLGKGRIGSVAFDDGFDTVNGMLQTDRPPTPLFENTPYIWAIWAWSDDGNLISHASREMLFVTGIDN